MPDRQFSPLLELDPDLGQLIGDDDRRAAAERELRVADTVSPELLGRGDVVRRWRVHDASALLRHSVRWTALSRTRFALLDRRFAIDLGRYPEVSAAIFD